MKNLAEHPLVVVIGIIAALATIVPYAQSIYKPDPPKPDPAFAEITEPLERQDVERIIPVTGTLTNLKKGDDLWISVYPLSEERYYPSRVEYDSIKKKWQVTLRIGSEDQKESGHSYKLELFTADAITGEDLIRGKESGIAKLPLSINSLKSLTVRRK
jgi:hypothetical protein